ncbi:hypothetical protein MASR1M6_27200 [Rubrivivax sp.]
MQKPCRACTSPHWVASAPRSRRFLRDPAEYLNRAGRARQYWHPADRPGYMHLHALTLRDARGVAAWSWRGDEPGAALALQGATRRRLEIGAPAEDGEPLRLLLTGGEAGIALPMPGRPSRHRTKAAPAPGASGQCGWPLSADYLALREALASAPRAPVDETVEIIVPVYGGLPHLRRCLTSVMGTLGRHPWHLTVIDDASPDAETRSGCKPLPRCTRRPACSPTRATSASSPP